MYDRIHAAADLDHLAQLWPDLHAARDRTAAGRATGSMGIGLSAHLAELQAAEHADRTADAPGWAPCPADLHVIDTMILVADAILLAEHRARHERGQTLRHRPRPEPGAYDDRPVWAARALADVLIDCDDHLVADIAATARTCLHATRRALDLAEKVRALPARCPFCASPLVLRTETPSGAIVLCTGDGCDPASWQGRFRRRPAWLPGEWEQLRQLLDASRPGAA